MTDVIVTGGRDYDDYLKLFRVLDLLGPTLIIEGGASGADRFARAYAHNNSLPLDTVEADWQKHGRAAGPIRNKAMLLKHPGAIVVAFPGGAGTANCVSQAKAMGRLVIRVE